MTTGEERMAARAQVRKREQQPAADSEYDRVHGTHHAHLKGTSVYCSCGEFHGITCVAFPPEWATMTEEQVQAEIDAISCDICGKRGVVNLGGGTDG